MAGLQETFPSASHRRPRRHRTTSPSFILACTAGKCMHVLRTIDTPGGQKSVLARLYPLQTRPVSSFSSLQYYVSMYAKKVDQECTDLKQSEAKKSNHIYTTGSSIQSSIVFSRSCACMCMRSRVRCCVHDHELAWAKQGQGVSQRAYRVS